METGRENHQSRVLQALRVVWSFTNPQAAPKPAFLLPESASPLADNPSSPDLMIQASWDQSLENPKSLTLSLPSLGAYQLMATEAINQLASSANRVVTLHFNSATFELDFEGLTPANRQKVGQSRQGTASSPGGDVCRIEQNGQWLSLDGWQKQPQALRLRPVGSPTAGPPVPPPVEVPKVPRHKVCKNVLPDGSVCNKNNLLDARVCGRCGSADHFETVYA
jgi:hypothetical protein